MISTATGVFHLRMLCNKVEKSKRYEYHHYIDLVIFTLKRKQMKLFFYLLTAATITLGFQCVWFVNPLGQESCQQSLSHQDTPNLSHVWDNDRPLGQLSRTPTIIVRTNDCCPWSGDIYCGHKALFTHTICVPEVKYPANPVLGQQSWAQSCPGQFSGAPILSRDNYRVLVTIRLQQVRL